ncbi:proprotein convertase P-domain-containing protein [Saccharothrix coeruleofusca]|uniref:proprotein convertase P-domain-containing protein n=1 Tax=Saccharothrix coeruleofusca TaxID=33919 RepID=UPI001AE73F4E
MAVPAAHRPAAGLPGAAERPRGPPITTPDLIAPDGTTYRLQHQPTSSQPDPGGTFTVGLPYETRDGTWRLRVHNVVWAGPGSLDRWSLTL